MPVQTINYFRVFDVASYNQLKEVCTELFSIAESIVPSTKRFERLTSDEASQLSKLVEDNPIEGCLTVNSIDFALFLLGAKEVSSTDLHNFTLGKGKEKKYYFCSLNDNNRKLSEPHADSMGKDLQDGLFVLGPTAYFCYQLIILSLQHRLKMFINCKMQNVDCPDLKVFFRVLPANFAGVLDRHSKRTDKAQHVMASAEMFGLQWQAENGFENPSKTLSEKLSDLFATTAIAFVARAKGYGWHPSKAQSPTTREYLSYVDTMAGGLEAFKQAIANVYNSQFGEDGKKRWWVQTPKLTPSMIATLGMLESSQDEAIAEVPQTLLDALIAANEVGTDAFSVLFNELRKRYSAIKQINDRLVFHALVKAWIDYKAGVASDGYYPDKKTEERIREKKVSLARLPGIDSLNEVSEE